MTKTTPEMQSIDFEKSLETLQDTIKKLESGQLSLEDSLGHFEAGVKMVRQCQDYLQKAEKRVEILLGETEAGQPKTEPFSHSS